MARSTRFFEDASGMSISHDAPQKPREGRHSSLIIEKPSTAFPGLGGLLAERIRLGIAPWIRYNGAGACSASFKKSHIR